MKPVLSASNAPGGLDDIRVDAEAEDEENVVWLEFERDTLAVTEVDAVGLVELAGAVVPDDGVAVDVSLAATDVVVDVGVKVVILPPELSLEAGPMLRESAAKLADGYRTQGCQHECPTYDTEN